MTHTETAGYITKCRNGHAARYTTEQQAALRAPWSSSKHGAMACTVCNATAQFAPIRVRITDTECGPRCTSAIGPACDCKCGGENHAADHAA